MLFQEKLRILRKQRKLSQEDLAAKIGITRQSVAKWETGQSYPETGNLLSLSRLLNVSMDRLVKPDEDGCALGVDSPHMGSIEKIAGLLCKAKKSTYAGKGKEAVPSRPNSHDFHYIEGAYKYIDTYIGGEEFAGEEAVWCQDIPVWALNYLGRVLQESFSGAFLQEALSLVPLESPFRGPALYQSGDYSYHCHVTGDFAWFQGYEEIFCITQKVYECHFHGGNVE